MGKIALQDLQNIAMLAWRSLPSPPLAPALSVVPSSPPPPQIKRREKLLALDFISFCEALARITCFKPLPSDSFIRECGVTTLVECIDMLIAEHKCGTRNHDYDGGGGGDVGGVWRVVAVCGG